MLYDNTAHGSNAQEDKHITAVPAVDKLSAV